MEWCCLSESRSWIGSLGSAGAATSSVCILCQAGTYQTGSGLQQWWRADRTWKSVSVVCVYSNLQVDAAMIFTVSCCVKSTPQLSKWCIPHSFADFCAFVAFLCKIPPMMPPALYILHWCHCNQKGGTGRVPETLSKNCDSTVCLCYLLYRNTVMMWLAWLLQGLMFLVHVSFV